MVGSAPVHHVARPARERFRPGPLCGHRAPARVLLVPQEGMSVLVNRQPTLVRAGGHVACVSAGRQESMLGMRLRIGPHLSFSASCAPVEALRGDYDGDGTPLWRNGARP